MHRYTVPYVMWGLLGLNLVIGVFQFVRGEIEDVSFV